MAIKIHPSAKIGSTSVLDKPYRQLLEGSLDVIEDTIISENVEINEFCVVGQGSNLKKGVILDDYSKIESNVFIGQSCLLIYGAQVGNDVLIGDNCVIGGFIGENVKIGNNCRIFGKLIHSQLDPTKAWDSDSSEEAAPIIGDDVFIGINALIIGGIMVSKQSYICSGAIVTKDVPSGHICYSRNKTVHHSGWNGKLKDSSFFRGV